MTKTERNAKIVEMSKLDKNQTEIAKELQCSIRTVQRVLAESMTTVEKSKLDKTRQNNFVDPPTF